MGARSRTLNSSPICFEGNSKENVVFENKNGYQMVINHHRAMESESDILKQYRIPAAHSQEFINETNFTVAYSC